ncbi:hypothetical protein BC938DRAFT_482504 [Jimgerdemannia flammicorona]|uniref:tRNA-dihydrouridine(47) synthase [NAD(P)(+)] n=1 Tax=Jimgerdemannia flammicorona TaxID=994334 RepID=A0A433QDY6_9FUNG|nr:hypothetical protein BC938DRAFT_482504 [Jimgerdemannia flammicorona]
MLTTCIKKCSFGNSTDNFNVLHLSSYFVCVLAGNGDVFSYEDYYGFKEKSGVDGIMIGRGALIKPWLFDEIKSRRHWDISSRERFDILRKFSDYGLEHWGSDTQVTCAFPSSKQRIGAKAQANSGIQYSPY